MAFLCGTIQPGKKSGTEGVKPQIHHTRQARQGGKPHPTHILPQCKPSLTRAPRRQRSPATNARRPVQSRRAKRKSGCRQVCSRPMSRPRTLTVAPRLCSTPARALTVAADWRLPAAIPDTTGRCPSRRARTSPILRRLRLAADRVIPRPGALLPRSFANRSKGA